ncbi:MAG: cupin-like domain-containing protein [Lysobacter sp.]
MIDERILSNIPGMKDAKAVAVVHAESLSEAEFRRSYVDQNIPVLVKGAIRHWPAVQRWSDKQYLKDRVGDNKVNLYPNLYFSDAATMKATAIPQTFSTALDVLHSEDSGVVFLPFRVEAQNSKFTDLREDIPGVKFLAAPKAPLFYPRARAFMFRGAGSGWHSHTVDETLMCQIRGCKRVALLPTNDGNYSELKRIFMNDLYLDDADAFGALAANMRPVVADVDTGDALYIPPNWWHGVQPMDHSAGATLTYCWRSPLHKISDFSYAPVREMWRQTYSRPSMAMLVLPLWGAATLLGQVVYAVKKMFARPAAQPSVS